MTLDTVLRLGRVSNLPTVWSNALAGAVLAGGAPPETIALAALALSVFYVGGMWLNDAYDAAIDAVERPGRPIPSGDIRRETVFGVGFGLIGLGCILAFAVDEAAGIVGIALAGFIIVYDGVHKRTVLAPLLMGATRFLAYGLGAAAAGGWTAPAVWGAAGLFALVVGLTYAARQEAYDRIDRAWPLAVLAIPAILAVSAAPILALGFLAALAAALIWLFRRARGDVPRAVLTLIAGISLYDAALIAGAGQPGLAAIAAGCFAVTLLLQRVVPGT